MTALSLIFDLIGKDNVSPAMHKAGDSAETAGHKISGLGKLAIGGALVAGAVLVGEKLKHIGEEGVDAFREVTGGALGLQRVMGGTVEETSRLAFAAHETGVNADVLSIGMRILSKNIGSGGKAFADFGINVKDASGHLLPQQEVLARVADQFAKLPNGPAKSAEALKLFGRQGAALIPLLNKGSEGIKELGKESDKLGLTVSGKDAAALKQYNLAHRQLGAAMEGVKVSIGRALLPVLATAATAFAANGVKIAELVQGAMRPLAAVAGLVGSALTTYVVPALTGITEAIGPAVNAAESFVRALPPPVIQALGIAFGLVAAALAAQAIATAAVSAATSVAAAVTALFATTVNAETGATERGVIARLAHNVATIASAVAHGAAAAAAGVWTAAQWLLNAALDANPIGLLVIAIAALVGGLILAWRESSTFRDIVTGAMDAVTGAASAVLDFFRDHWALILGFLTGPIGLAVVAIATHWDTIKSAIDTAWEAIKTALTTVLDAIKTAFITYVDAWVLVITTAWDTIKNAVAGAWDAIKTALETVFGAIKTAFTLYVDAWILVITTAWNTIHDAVAAAWNAIKTALEAAFGLISTAFTTAFNAYRDTVLAVWTAIKNAVAAAWDAISTVLSTAVSNLKASFKADIDLLVGVVGAVWTAIKNAVAGAWGAVETAVGTAVAGVKRTLTSDVSALTGVVGDVWTAIKNAVPAAFAAIGSAITGAASGFGDLLRGAGAAVIDGFIQGVKDGFQRVRDTFSTLTGLIPSWKGPPATDATILFGAGQLVMGGFVSGLRSEFGTVRSALGDATGLLNVGPLSVSGAGDGVGAHFDRLGDRLEKALRDQVRDQVTLARSGA